MDGDLVRPGAEHEQLVREFLVGYLGQMHLDGEVSIVLAENAVEVSITGEGLGPLIGQRGTVLAALQEILRAVLQAHSEGPAPRVHLDISGYRAKRVDALERFTQETAELALSSGKPEAFEPMSAADRKVVHDVIQNIAGLTSHSEGEEPRRFVVITPEKPANDGTAG